MTNLYPEREPYESGHFDTGQGHKLYYARYGNPEGDPVVYLHGGPGGSCTFEYRLFNPDHYNILLFDQRGAGKSLPTAEIEHNNMGALVADIESLRENFGIHQWHVAGGSFGSCLGMFYALHYPERVNKMLLRGIFFGDAAGARFIIDEDGSAAANRNKWFQDYYSYIPAEERIRGLTLPYYHRLISEDKAEAVEAARLFHVWDTSLITVEPPLELIDKINRNPGASLPLSRLFFHYVVHSFTKANKKYLIEGMGRLKNSIDIIHGRQDKITPVDNALELHYACHGSRLNIIDNCGHGMVEPGLQQAFLAITDRWMTEK